MNGTGHEAENERQPSAKEIKVKFDSAGDNDDFQVIDVPDEENEEDGDKEENKAEEVASGFEHLEKQDTVKEGQDGGAGKKAEIAKLKVPSKKGERRTVSFQVEEESDKGSKKSDMAAIEEESDGFGNLSLNSDDMTEEEKA